MAEYDERVKAREAEVNLAIYFAKALMNEIGKERAYDILKKGWSDAWTAGLSKALEGIPTANRFEAFGNWMKERAKTDPWLEVLEVTPERVAIKITKCPTYDACKNKGAVEVCQAYCDSDYLSAPLIHPKVKITRDKEIGYGADYCNHVWTLQD